MKIEKDKMVALSYELREGSFEGEVIEKVPEDDPMVFLYGSGNMLKKFEENLEGKKQGEDFSFLMSPADSYGEYAEDRIIQLPLRAFLVDGKINEDIVAVGKTVPMQDTSGNKLLGLILEIDKENVKMDFNHPMAGKTLAFKGNIIEVRDATDQELYAHVHGHDPSECSGCGKTCGQ